MNLCFARGAAVALTALVVAPATGSHLTNNPTRDFARRLGFDDDSIASLERGGVIAKILDASVDNEVSVAGAVRIDVSREYFVERWRDIATFKRGPNVPEIGTFSNPPAVQDLATLTVPPADVAAFRRCRTDHCDVKLPVETLGALQRGHSDGRATADGENVRIFKEMLTARVQAFLSGGPVALTPYAGSLSDPPRAQIEAILAAAAKTLQDVPEFREYLAEYPRMWLADVEALTYWSRETASPKPIISLTHLSLYTKTFDVATITIGTATDLYSSHYVDGSIGFTLAIEPADQRGASFYLFYVNRSRIDVLKGTLGGFSRWIVKRRVRSVLGETLALTKRLLEEALSRRGSAGASPYLRHLPTRAVGWESGRAVKVETLRDVGANSQKYESNYRVGLLHQ